MTHTLGRSASRSSPRDTWKQEEERLAGLFAIWWPRRIYAIEVDGIVCYIGKGKGNRIYSHMNEVRGRLARDFKFKNVWPKLQQKLTEAAINGASIEEEILVESLENEKAYWIEYQRIYDICSKSPDQLWNINGFGSAPRLQVIGRNIRLGTDQ